MTLSDTYLYRNEFIINSFDQKQDLRVTETYSVNRTLIARAIQAMNKSVESRYDCFRCNTIPKIKQGTLSNETEEAEHIVSAA